MNTLNTSVGQLVIVKSETPLTNGLWERKTMKVRIISNDGLRAEWELVELLSSENLLRVPANGGFSLNPSILQQRVAAGELANWSE